MKGTISRCLALMVRAKAGDGMWKEIVKDSNAGPSGALLEIATADVDDAVVGRLMASTCKHMKLTSEQACDAFGEYWCCDYAPKLYSTIWRRFKTSRDMILGMDQVHIEVTDTMEKARPPRFDYTWKDDKTLVVKYKSRRHMIDVYVGLLRGVGKAFKEKLSVKKLTPDTVEIVFA
jgi:hypothetical protein